MTHTFNATQTQSDFDHIATLVNEQAEWNHNNHYHHFLLKQMPAKCQYALDIGCGTGDFARLLADHSERVLALDLSPEMIRVAKEHSQKYSNITYQAVDVLTWGHAPGQFNYIASIATLHHLPTPEMLTKMKMLLAPGGKLAILDLYQAQLPDLWLSLLAMPASTLLKWLKNGRIHDTPAVRAAWEAHAKHDRYLTIAQLRAICADILPGATIKRHLFWRYSLVWQKPLVTLSQ